MPTNETIGYFEDIKEKYENFTNTIFQPSIGNESYEKLVSESLSVITQFAASLEQVPAEYDIHTITKLLAAKNKDGNTLLHFAAAYGDVAMLETLLIDCKMHFSTLNKNGFSAIHVAAACRQQKAIKFIIKHSILSIFSVDNGGYSALHLASYMEYPEILGVLLFQCRTKPYSNILKIKDGEGFSSLNYAQDIGYLNSYKAIADAAHGDKLPKKNNKYLQWWKTALETEEEQQLPYRLRRYNSKLFDCNPRKETLLHIAAAKGNLGLVRYLLNIIKDKNIPLDFTNVWPPHFRAAIKGHKAIIELFVQFGIDITKTHETWTILHEAVSCKDSGKRAETVRYILEYDAVHGCRLLNAREENGMTVVHIASLARHDDTLELLKKYNVDTTIRDNYGIQDYNINNQEIEPTLVLPKSPHFMADLLEHTINKILSDASSHLSTLSDNSERYYVNTLHFFLIEVKDNGSVLSNYFYGQKNADIKKEALVENETFFTSFGAAKDKCLENLRIRMDMPLAPIELILARLRSSKFFIFAVDYNKNGVIEYIKAGKLNECIQYGIDFFIWLKEEVFQKNKYKKFSIDCAEMNPTYNGNIIAILAKNYRAKITPEKIYRGSPKESDKIIINGIVYYMKPNNSQSTKETLFMWHAISLKTVTLDTILCELRNSKDSALTYALEKHTENLHGKSASYRHINDVFLAIAWALFKNGKFKEAKNMYEQHSDNKKFYQDITVDALILFNKELALPRKREVSLLEHDYNYAVCLYYLGDIKCALQLLGTIYWIVEDKKTKEEDNNQLKYLKIKLYIILAEIFMECFLLEQADYYILKLEDKLKYLPLDDPYWTKCHHLMGCYGFFSGDNEQAIVSFLDETNSLVAQLTSNTRKLEFAKNITYIARSLIDIEESDLYYQRAREIIFKTDARTIFSIDVLNLEATAALTNGSVISAINKWENAVGLADSLKERGEIGDNYIVIKLNCNLLMAYILEFIDNRCTFSKSEDKVSFINNLEKLFSIMQTIMQHVIMLDCYISAEKELRKKAKNFRKFHDFFPQQEGDLFIKVACLMCLYKAIYSFVNKCNYYGKIEKIINLYGEKLFSLMPYDHPEANKYKDFFDESLAVEPEVVNQIRLRSGSQDRLIQITPPVQRVARLPSQPPPRQKAGFFSCFSIKFMEQDDRPVNREPLSEPRSLSRNLTNFE
ncbi:MAG: ankyrin repeat domain-containing protein [Gammaproteobacteria bacterium]